MALTWQIFHKPVTAVGNVNAALLAFYNWVAASSPLDIVCTSATGPTTVVALGSSGAWFVARHPITGWEIWFGGEEAPASSWDAAYRKGMHVDYIGYSVSWDGGWDAANDDPTRAPSGGTDWMFSLAEPTKPDILYNYTTTENTRKLITWCFGTVNNAAEQNQWTMWYSEEALIILWDKGGTGPSFGNWNNGLALIKFQTKWGDLDTHPYVALAGYNCVYGGSLAGRDNIWTTGRYTGNDYIEQNGILYTPSGVTNTLSGPWKYTVPFLTGWFEFNSNNQPNPYTGFEEWAPVHLTGFYPGRIHHRGIFPAGDGQGDGLGIVRQVNKNYTHRTLFTWNPGTPEEEKWVMVTNTVYTPLYAGIALPWPDYATGGVLPT